MSDTSNEEYAKQQVIAFMNWLAENKIKFRRTNKKWEKWEDEEDGGQVAKLFTTEQLYERYIQPTKPFDNSQEQINYLEGKY